MNSLLYNKIGGGGLFYLLTVFMTMSDLNSDHVGYFSYQIALLNIFIFLILFGHNHLIYKSNHDDTNILSSNFISRSFHIFISLVALAPFEYIYLRFFGGDKYISYYQLPFFIVWQYCGAIFNLYFEYSRCIQSGIRAFIFSNTTVNLLLVMTCLLLNIFNIPSATNVLYIGGFTSFILLFLLISSSGGFSFRGLKLDRSIFNYYKNNLGITITSTTSLVMYNFDVIFVGYLYPVNILNNYAMGSKLAGILNLINSFVYSLTPGILRKETLPKAYKIIKILIHTALIISGIIILVLAIYIYHFRSDSFLIFLIFCIGNIINIFNGPRLPFFVKFGIENILAKISTIFAAALVIMVGISCYAGGGVIEIAISVAFTIALQSFVEKRVLYARTPIPSKL